MEKNALAALPLSVLDLTRDQDETFSLWGIRTLGSLANLPMKGLIARLGQAGKCFAQLAHGTRSHLFQSVEPAFSLLSIWGSIVLLRCWMRCSLL